MQQTTSKSSPSQPPFASSNPPESSSDPPAILQFNQKINSISPPQTKLDDDGKQKITVNKQSNATDDFTSEASKRDIDRKLPDFFLILHFFELEILDSPKQSLVIFEKIYSALNFHSFRFRLCHFLFLPSSLTKGVTRGLGLGSNWAELIGPHLWE